MTPFGFLRTSNAIRRVLALALITVTVLSAAALFLFSAEPYEIQIEFTANRGSQGDIYWSQAGEPYNEWARKIYYFQPHAEKRVSVLLPAKSLTSLRIDPTNTPGRVTIRNVRLSRFPFSTELTLTEAGSFPKALHDIRRLKVEGGHLVVETLTADGAFEVRLDRPFENAFYWLCGVGFAALLLTVGMRRELAYSWERVSSFVSVPRICLAALVLFALLTGFKIHGSSVHLWNDIFLDQDNSGRIIGVPRSIRSDEWLVGTPFLLAQARHRPAFPVENESLGGEASALLIGMPATHPATVFRPALWGFFFLDEERAFSFAWNFRLFGLILTTFLILTVLTKNSLGLSSVLSLFFAYSSFTQWWFSTPFPELVIALNGGVYSLVRLCAAQKTVETAAWTFGCAAAAVSFVLNLYPPFQVPLALLAIPLLATSFALRRKELSGWRNILPSLIAGLLLASGAVFLFIRDAGPTMELMLGTAYPGQRSFSGGGLPWARYFSGLLDIFMFETQFPAALGNVCEASNVIYLWPGVVLGLLFRRAVPRHALPIGVYVLVMTVWLIAGLGTALESVLLLRTVPSTRVFGALSLADVYLAAIFLSSSGERGGRGVRMVGIAAVVCGAGAAALTLAVNAYIHGYYQPHHVAVASVLAALVWSAVSLRWKGVLSFVLLGAYVVPNLTINPVARGLAPLLDRESVRVASAIREQDPEARWLIFGDGRVGSSIKVAGVRSLSGVSYAPRKDVLSILDPEGRHEYIHNRFAHVVFAPATVPEPQFHLIQADLYQVTIDPCGSELRELGVKYVGFAHYPAPLTFRCLRPLRTHALDRVLWLYRIVPESSAVSGGSPRT